MEIIKEKEVYQTPAVEVITFNLNSHACPQLLVDTHARKYLFCYYRRNTELFLLAILFWGFPLNRNLLSAVFQNWNQLVKFARYLKNHKTLTLTEFNALIPKMENMPNLGITTFSKLFYFNGISIDGHLSVILDSFVIKGISNLQGDSFKDLKACTLPRRYRFYRYYPQYLASIHQLAGNNAVDSVEYTLWLAGKKIK